MVQVNWQEDGALLHSGIVVTLLQADWFCRKLLQRHKVKVIGVHGKVKDHLISCVTLCTSAGTATSKVGVGPGLPHDLLIGRDCPGFWNMYEETLDGLGNSPNDLEPSENQSNTVLQNEIYVEKCQGMEPTVDSEHDTLKVFVKLEAEGTSSEQG